METFWQGRYVISLSLLIAAALSSVLLPISAWAEVFELPAITVTPEIRLPGVPADRLDRRSVLQGSTLDLLKTSPALHVSEVAALTGGPLAISIRGRSPEQTRYFLEGISLSDAQFNSAPAHLIPFESLAGMDIYPGGVPTDFAEEGLAGAVNLRLERIGRPGQVRIRAGSYSDLRVATDLSLENPSGRFGLAYARTEGDFTYLDDNGTPYNPSDDSNQRRRQPVSQNLSVVPRFSLLKRKGFEVDWIGLHAFRESGFSGPTTSFDPGLSREFFHLAVLRGIWKGPSDSAIRSHVTGRLYASNDSVNTEGTSVGLARLTRSTQNTVGTKWDAVFQAGRWRGLTAAGARYESYAAEDAARRGNSNRRISVPIAVALGREFSHSTEADIGLVGLPHWYSGSGEAGTSTRTFVSLSPRVSAAWRLAGNSLRTSFGNYTRAPSSFELFGAPTGVDSNLALRPENAWQAELRLTRGNPKRAVVVFTLAASDARDLITFEQTSQNARTARNIDRSRILTAELEVRMRPLTSIQLEGWGVWMDARNQSPISYATDRVLPLHPRWRTSLSALWNRGPFEVGYRFDWMSSRYADLANLKQIVPFGEHSLGAAYTVAGWGELRFEVKNLTDVTTVDSRFESLDAFDYTTGLSGYPAAGRRFYLTWSYSI